LSRYDWLVAPAALVLVSIWYVVAAFAITMYDPKGLVFDQAPDDPPQIASGDPTAELITVPGAPCMVEEMGKCRIRANHLEVR
jgi:hypothetical protein